MHSLLPSSACRSPCCACGCPTGTSSAFGLPDLAVTAGDPIEGRHAPLWTSRSSPWHVHAALYLYAACLPGTRPPFCCAEFRKHPLACLTLASFLATNTGDVARRHIRDPELLSFIDIECFCWSTVLASMTPMINAGMVFCDRSGPGRSCVCAGLDVAPCYFLLLGAGRQAAQQGLLLQGICGQQNAVTPCAPINLSNLRAVPLQALWRHQLPARRRGQDCRTTGR